MTLQELISELQAIALLSESHKHRRVVVGAEDEDTGQDIIRVRHGVTCVIGTPVIRIIVPKKTAGVCEDCGEAL